MSANLAAAVVALQAELPVIGKDKTAQVKSDKGSYSYDYADLTTISYEVLPLLSKHGLSFIAAPTVTEHGFVLAFQLLHASGESTGGSYPLPDPARSTPQQIGSAITYGRRYCLTAVTGIAPGGEDDDGQKAADARSRPKQDHLASAALLDDMTVRIDLATTLTELTAIEAEAKRGFTEGRLISEDARRVKELIANRQAELNAPVRSSA